VRLPRQPLIARAATRDVSAVCKKLCPHCSACPACSALLSRQRKAARHLHAATSPRFLPPVLALHRNTLTHCLPRLHADPAPQATSARRLEDLPSAQSQLLRPRRSRHSKRPVPSARLRAPRSAHLQHRQPVSGLRCVPPPRSALNPMPVMCDVTLVLSTATLVHELTPFIHPSPATD